MKRFFPQLSTNSFNAGNKLKRSLSRLSRRSQLAIVLISLAAAATLITFVVSASRKTNSGTGVSPVKHAQDARATKPLTRIANRRTMTPLAPMFAPTITATLGDGISLASNANPGSTITYTATISNTAAVGNDAFNVVYTDTLDNNTTLVPGSVKTTPIAFDDAYNVIGNVDIQPNVAQGLLANDIDPDTGNNTGLTVTTLAGDASAPFAGTSTQGGQVTAATGDGSFQYNPPVGFQGTDTFTYTVTDPTGKTGTGTVTLIVSGMIWFIDNNAAACTTLAAGCGRLTSPFSNLGAFQGFNDNNLILVPAHPRNNDNIFIFESGTNYIGPVTLLNGQRLFGQDSTTSPANTALQTLTGLPVQAYSDPLPTMNSGNGTFTMITSAGVAVNLNGSGAAANNFLNGFTVGNSTTGINGSSFGTLNVGDVVINTNGQALVLNTGTVATPTHYPGFTSTTSTGGANNVSLTTIASPTSVNLGSGALSGAGGNGFNVNGGTANINFSGTISNSTARQVSIINKTGGTVALSGAVSGTGTGIFLNTNTGATMNFSGNLTLSTGSNTAFNATGGGTVTATNTASTAVTTTGTAVNITGTTIGAGGVKFLSVSSNGAANGIVLTSTGAGAFTVIGDGTAANNGSGGTIQATTGDGILMTDVSNISLNQMNITNPGLTGIKVIPVGWTFSPANSSTTNGVTNFTLNRCNLSDNAGAVTADDGLTLANGGGNIAITNDVFTTARHQGVTIDNFSFNMASLTMTGSSITGTPGGDGMLIQMRGTSVMTTGTIGGATTGNTFSGNSATGLQVSNSNTSNIASLTVQGNTVSGNNAGMDFDLAQSSSMTIVVGGANAGEGNTFTNQTFQSINLFSDTGSTAGTMTATLRKNTIGTLGVQDSGSKKNGNGIYIHLNGGKAGSITVDGNIIQEVPNASLLSIEYQAYAAGNTMKVKVINNQLKKPTAGTANGFCGPANTVCPSSTFAMFVDSNGGAFSTICTTISGNSVFDPTSGPNGAGLAAFQLGVRTAGNTMNIEGTQANARNQIITTNTITNPGGSPSSSDVFVDSGTPAIVPVGTCGSFPAIVNPDENAYYMPARSDAPTSGGTNASPTTSAWLKEILHPVAAFATKLNFLRKSEAPTDRGISPRVSKGSESLNESDGALPDGRASAPSATNAIAPQQKGVTPALTAAEKSAMIAEVKGISAPQKPDDQKVTPQSGETITVNGNSANGFTLPAGKTITITYDATVNSPPLAKTVTTQGKVHSTTGNFADVFTDDQEVPPNGPADPTVTNINTTITWIGVTSTDWNTASNWDFNYVPVSSSDVKVPNAAQPNQPTLSSSSPTINSLNLGNTRVLTISGQTLTITGSTASDLTLDGNINGGALSFGAGTHTIFNAGPTGSITPTNLTTVLNGANVTLNNNLQMDSLTINSGGTLNITNRTLSLTGSLNNGGTFTHPVANGDEANPSAPPGDGLQLVSSTVVFNGTGAQTLTDTTAFNNLTINNTGGSVTLGSNATVNGTLTLTSDLTTTNAFTLTMPIAGIISGGADVVGNITRTNGGPSLPTGTTIAFGNPNTTLNFIVQGTVPTSINFRLTKTAPTDAATGGTNTGFPGAVHRTWLITQVGGVGFKATMQLHYLVGDLGSNVETTTSGPSVSLRMYKYVILSPSTGWQQQDFPNFANTTIDTSTPGNHFVKYTNVTSFSPWTLGGVSPTAATSTVTGRITDDAGNPVEGAVVRLNGTQDRKTITDSQGNYSFAEVETNGFYTVTPSRVNYNFAPSTRGFSALGAHTEASFGAALNGNHLNPLDTTEYFVRQQYVDFLGREPEEKGFNDWTDTINNCAPGDASCDRVHVSESFFRSEEFQQRGYFIYRFYSTAFGQKPDYAAFAPDLGRVSGFLDATQLEAAKTQFANDFTARAAFVNQYGQLSNAQYVDALAATAGVTLSNRQALVNSLSTGTMTRAQALRQIAESGEVYGKYYNQAFVVMEYFGYLKRDPDALYLNWIQVLDANPADSRRMVEGFVDATEYRNRFKQ